MSRSSRLKSLVFLCMLAGSPVLAQDDPELGVTAPAAPGGGAAFAKKKAAGKRPSAQNTPEPAPAPVVDATPAADASASTSTGLDAGWEKPATDGEADDNDTKGDSDHDAVVGRIGVGLLGQAEIPVGVGDPAGVLAGAGFRTTSSPLSMPVLGARYWLTSRFGVEGGIGFAFSGGSITVTGASDADNASTRAFALHGGAPISVMAGKHYNLIAVPYLGLGFSSATDTRGTAPNTDDVFGKGLLFEAGLKGGVEVQLGSVGLEGLALQITGGVRLRYESTSANVPVLNATGMATGSSDIEVSNIVFATSPGSTLGSAVAGSIAAVYYF